jgi:hypothetical protein
MCLRPRLMQNSDKKKVHSRSHFHSRRNSHSHSHSRSGVKKPLPQMLTRKLYSPLQICYCCFPFYLSSEEDPNKLCFRDCVSKLSAFEGLAGALLQFDFSLVKDNTATLTTLELLSLVNTAVLT